MQDLNQSGRKLMKIVENDNASETLTLSKPEMNVWF